MRSTTRQRVRGGYPATTPVPTEILAQSIREIAEGMKRLRSGALNDRALLVLLADSTGVSKSTIKLVLAGLTDLEKDFIRKSKT